jgi:NAD(P)H dehydrogenase (quinone)
VLDVTGPAALKQADLADIASDLTGRPIAHMSIGPEALRARLSPMMPPARVDALVYFDVAAAQGHHAVTTEVVRDLTGQAPMSVREFLTAHRDALVPAVASQS